jgi:hypothetical protein
MYAVTRRIVEVEGLTPCFRIFIALLQLFQLQHAWVLTSPRAADWFGFAGTESFRADT